MIRAKPGSRGFFANIFEGQGLGFYFRKYLGHSEKDQGSFRNMFMWERIYFEL